ncbi:hypothetical protein R3P38DRAFT_3244543 [Favolaschia claudopus]|uniref:Uncharacterized protein n=1 Tax=Favolaschia claudopus TaxID=2862362 RepID=A0AAV9Z1N0_9AGAR
MIETMRSRNADPAASCRHDQIGTILIATLSCQRVDAAEHLARPLSLLHAFSSRFGSRIAVFTFQHPSASLLVFQGLIFIKFSLRLQILEYLVSSILYTLSPYDTILRSILRSSASYHLSPRLRSS